jgi:tRNA U34 5-methylaminomethyl-2-thiouridine-forming methyltransferase MnmC
LICECKFSAFARRVSTAGIGYREREREREQGVMRETAFEVGINLLNVPEQWPPFLVVGVRLRDGKAIESVKAQFEAVRREIDPDPQCE